MDVMNVLSEKLITHLWAVSWQVSILFGIIWIVDKVSVRASSLFRYWLWLIVLVRLCIPLNITLPGGLGHYILENIRGGLPHLQSMIVRNENPDKIAFQESSTSGGDVLSVNPDDIKPVEYANKFAASDIAGKVWLVSVFFICAIILHRIIRINRRLEECGTIERADLILLFQRLKKDFGLTRSIGLHYMDIDNFDVPAVIGVLRPGIFLPRSIAENWSIEDIEPVLLHELAHIKRHDHFVNFLQVIIQVVYFFHPVVWFVNRRIRKLREQLSDDLAISRLGLENKRYSVSILRVMEYIVEKPAPGFIGIGISERKSITGERIKRIMDTNYKNITKLTALSIVMVAIIGTAGLFVSCGQLLAKEKIPPWDKPGGVPVGNIMTDEQIEAVKKSFERETREALRFPVATIKGDNLSSSEVIDKALDNIDTASKYHSSIWVVPKKNMPFDTPGFSNVPMIIISADKGFKLTQKESENLGTYLRNGGFAFLDNGTPEFEVGEAEASLRQALRDALKSDARFLPIPITHPLLNCFHLFSRKGIPPGKVPFSGETKFLEGIWIEDRLVAVYSDMGYIHTWTEYGIENPQFSMGMNLVIFAALQKCDKLESFSQTNTQMPVKVTVLNNGEYEVGDIHVTKANLREILKEELAKSKSKKVEIIPESEILNEYLLFAKDAAKELGVKGIAIKNP
ncbi:M56 family metallopeptidase, partial [Candidatus Latescibacterota bacterium]